MQDVRFTPIDGASTVAKPLPRLRQRGGRQIENGDAAIARVEQSIDERRRSGADIDDGLVMRRGDASNELVASGSNQLVWSGAFVR